MRDKPPTMIAASPKATVPILILPNGDVIDESLNIMLWAMSQNMTCRKLKAINSPNDEMCALIAKIDGPFKYNLDRYKYANRYENGNAQAHRDACLPMLTELNGRLITTKYLFGQNQTFADIAIAPFIRQFANTNKDWFYQTRLINLQAWLTDFCNSDSFQSIMTKYPQWKAGDPPTNFPPKD